MKVVRVLRFYEGGRNVMTLVAYTDDLYIVENIVWLYTRRGDWMLLTKRGRDWEREVEESKELFLVRVGGG